MIHTEARLEELGLVLPEPLEAPPGLVLPSSWVRVCSDRAYVSDHGPLDANGSVAEPLGKVGVAISEEQGYEAVRLTALAIFGSLKRELGDLDRVTAWLRVFGMVNSAPGFDRQPNVIKGFSDLMLKVYGPEAGDHARSAVGMAELPLGLPRRDRGRCRSSPSTEGPMSAIRAAATERHHDRVGAEAIGAYVRSIRGGSFLRRKRELR